MRKILALFLVATLLLASLPALAAYEPTELELAILEEFRGLNSVPRASHHEEQISDYLANWAKAHNLDYTQDELGNITIDKPATPGYENAPLVVLQGHMDMVAVADPDVDFDPVNDPIPLIVDENGKVYANGTSLGADCGLAVSATLNMLTRTDMTHGPLRAIFTINEEDGMDGASKIDASCVADATYLINVDGGYGGAVISCAGGNYWHFERAAEWIDAPAGTVYYEINFSGLKGGHSAGANSGKANALVMLADAMQVLRQNGIAFYIVDIIGGTARNAIPSYGTAQLLIDATKVDEAKALLDAHIAQFDSSYSFVETDYSVTYGPVDKVVAKVLSADVSKGLANLMATIPNNVHTMSQMVKNLIESSSNLGMIDIGEEIVSFDVYARSSALYQAWQIGSIDRTIAELCGFTCVSQASFSPWPINPDSKLAEIAKEVFFELTGKDYPVNAIHAGLECGEFIGKNLELDAIATGYTSYGGHSTSEHFFLYEIEPAYDFIVALLERLAK